MPCSFFNEQQSTSSAATPNCSFMMFELLTDVTLLTTETSSMDEIVTLCKAEYKGNTIEEGRIAEFQQTYTPETSITWYTRDCFVYRILNKALRVQNIEVLLAFRFLIKDIYEQLKKLQQNQHTNLVTVYRGQILPIVDLQRMHQNNGEIISIHSFLSTSYDRWQAMGFVLSSPQDHNLANVLFEIECDQCSSSLPISKPFAHINEVSFFPSENEVLFTLGSHFRIRSIDYDQERRLHIIKLTFVSETQEIKNFIQRNTLQLPSHLALGNLLHQLKEYEKHETYYKSLLTNLPENESKAMVYIVAGNGAREQKKFDLAL
ncbi:unnamed protein product, partial [Rotaria sp. Silwood1]